jgi:hypothetical protein
MNGSSTIATGKTDFLLRKLRRDMTDTLTTDCFGVSDRSASHARQSSTDRADRSRYGSDCATIGAKIPLAEMVAICENGL